jgi:hypothetical protein
MFCIMFNISILVGAVLNKCRVATQIEADEAARVAADTLANVQQLLANVRQSGGRKYEDRTFVGAEAIGPLKKGTPDLFWFPADHICRRPIIAQPAGFNLSDIKQVRVV